MQAVWTPRIASPGLARVRDIVHVVSLYNIYSAVLRSDLWALPALGTGHRLGIQNAPAGGPSQITDHTQNMVSFMRSRPHTGASLRGDGTSTTGGYWTVTCLTTLNSV